MSKRILFIIFALVVSGATVALVRVSMNGSSKLSASRRLRASTSPPMTRVLVATLGLPAGSVLQSNQMRWQNWPVDSAAPYATEGHASVGSFVGGVVRSRLTAGEPILASNVSRPGERGFMAAVLDPGSSAVTINVTPSTGMAGFISPGDRVDLLLTMTQPPGGAAPAHRFSETLLTNLRVVGVDQSLSDDKKPVAKDAPTPKTITLQVTSKQAEVVALGSEIGILSLSLKSLSSGLSGVAPPVGAPTWESEVSHVSSPPPSNGARDLTRIIPSGPMRGVHVFRGGEVADTAAQIAPLSAALP